MPGDLTNANDRSFKAAEEKMENYLKPFIQVKMDEAEEHRIKCKRSPQLEPELRVGKFLDKN